MVQKQVQHENVVDKLEISNQYSDIYGVFQPCKFEDLEEDDHKSMFIW